MTRICPIVLVACFAVNGFSQAIAQSIVTPIDSSIETTLDKEVWGLAPWDDCVTSEFQPQWFPASELSPNFTLRLRGRIDADAIWSSQSLASQMAFGELKDVVGMRRTRLGIEGELGKNGRYVAEFDLPTGELVPRDIYYSYGNPNESIEHRVGHFREPFSLEGGTSARYFPFMERSAINTLDPARGWGVGLFHETPDTNSALGLGLFHSGTGTWDFQGGEGSTVGLTGRYTRALVHERGGEQLLHLGIALSERIAEDGVIVINQRPRSSLLELEDSSTSPLVPTIRVPAHFQQLVNLQLVAAHDSLWTQAEWYGSVVAQSGGGTVFFHGMHIDCGYFLTGEHRNYHSASGTLGEVHVLRPVLGHHAADACQRGWGAWELAVRFAYLDFIDADTPVGPGGVQQGVRLSQLTAGVNWYLSDRVSMMFNYSYAVPDEINTGASAVNLFATRLAIFW